MSIEVPMTVPDGLRPLVKAVSVLRASEGEPLVHVPDTDTSLVFRTTSAGAGDLLVVGPRTRASYHAGKDIPFCLRLRLRPGAARPLLGVSVSEVVDRVVRLGDLWGAPADRLTATLRRADGDDALVLKHLETVLPTRTSTDGAKGELVQAAVQALSGRPGRRRAPVPAVARHLAVSERHLRTVFADAIGLSPKHFERIERVRQALLLAHDQGPRWADLAAATGYYDQSHMTAEFRTLMGVTPGAFLEGRTPALRPC
ncbi:helix-turn-helix domain-containing protein [Bailinhaonella thermotolerans]|uniref:AraC family transcriptional regulator n=1 Tax=Bailinhaonella thermotolerans TaxID=1070861 RepID=A0A3A4AD67_9ACTN|nr:helix-turn-helix domain-containing protein [Bailinhaonella thermotolerans]RJL24000.1 AraC family transcriptional regulator [Bailinhaonella thermotolerans]